MIYPFSIPTLARWLRFSDEDPDYYNSTSKNFLDLAGFAATPNSRLADMIFQAGAAPTFTARGANNRKMLLLDNSAYWGFYPVTPWHGSGYMIVQPHIVSTAVDFYPLLFGVNAVPLNAGAFHFRRGSGVNTMTIKPARDTAETVFGNFVSDNIYMLIWSLNQQTGNIKVSMDGGATITTRAAAVTANDGGPASLWQSGTNSTQGVIKALFGDLDNNPANVTANATDFLYVAEMGEWTSADPFADYPTQLAAFYADKKTYYGLV
jgi:hypothetical protein